MSRCGPASIGAAAPRRGLSGLRALNFARGGSVAGMGDAAVQGDYTARAMKGCSRTALIPLLARQGVSPREP